MRLLIKKAEQCKCSGFTLIELIIVMMILAIAISFALPSLSSFLRRNQIANASNELMATLSFARTEAIKLGVPVVVCPSNNGTTCAGGTAWEGGSIAFRDDDGNGALTTAGDILRKTPTASSGLTIELATAANIRFAPNGSLFGGSAGHRVTISHDNSPTGSGEDRYICVARGGRAAAMSESTWLNDARFADCRP
jgi:prepilin-type N-terminal cleavage/methylation domain-containing protein